MLAVFDIMQNEEGYMGRQKRTEPVPIYVGDIAEEISLNEPENGSVFDRKVQNPTPSPVDLENYAAQIAPENKATFPPIHKEKKQKQKLKKEKKVWSKSKKLSVFGIFLFLVLGIALAVLAYLSGPDRLTKKFVRAWNDKDFSMIASMVQDQTRAVVDKNRIEDLYKAAEEETIDEDLSNLKGDKTNWRISNRRGTDLFVMRQHGKRLGILPRYIIEIPSLKISMTADETTKIMVNEKTYDLQPDAPQEISVPLGKTKIKVYQDGVIPVSSEYEVVDIEKNELTLNAVAQKVTLTWSLPESIKRLDSHGVIKVMGIHLFDWEQELTEERAELYLFTKLPQHITVTYDIDGKTYESDTAIVTDISGDTFPLSLTFEKASKEIQSALDAVDAKKKLEKDAERKEEERKKLEEEKRGNVESALADFLNNVRYNAYRSFSEKKNYLKGLYTEDSKTYQDLEWYIESGKSDIATVDYYEDLGMKVVGVQEEEDGYHVQTVESLKVHYKDGTIQTIKDSRRDYIVVKSNGKYYVKVSIRK